MRFFISSITIILISLLTACASTHFEAGRNETVVPLHHAWVDGQKVEYITTDISDAQMANAAGVNYVARLKNAITESGPNSVLERVYKFPNGEQISIFQSAPKPTGGANANQEYSPLWRLVLVEWAKPEKAHELKSEAELLSAEDAGDVAVQVTKIVVNCPIIRGSDGKALKGVH